MEASGKKTQRERLHLQSVDSNQIQKLLFTTSAALSMVPVLSEAEMSQLVKKAVALETMATPVTAPWMPRWSRWKLAPRLYL